MPRSWALPVQHAKSKSKHPTPKAMRPHVNLGRCRSNNSLPFGLRLAFGLGHRRENDATDRTDEI
eukprot:860854-Amphidinium_carterae.1